MKKFFKFIQVNNIAQKLFSIKDISSRNIINFNFSYHP